MYFSDTAGDILFMSFLAFLSELNLGSYVLNGNVIGTTFFKSVVGLVLFSESISNLKNKL